MTKDEKNRIYDIESDFEDYADDVMVSVPLSVLFTMGEILRDLDELTGGSKEERQLNIFDDLGGEK